MSPSRAVQVGLAMNWAAVNGQRAEPTPQHKKEDPWSFLLGAGVNQNPGISPLAFAIDAGVT
jgi:hypothetical protein